jgi:hypothetical protein
VLLAQKYYLIICGHCHLHFYNLLTLYHQQPFQEPIDFLATQARFAGQIEAHNKLLNDREKSSIRLFVVRFIARTTGGTANSF